MRREETLTVAACRVCSWDISYAGLHAEDRVCSYFQNASCESRWTSYCPRY